MRFGTESQLFFSYYPSYPKQEQGHETEMSPRELLGGWAVGEAELGSTMPLDKVSGTSLGEFVSLTPSSCQQKEGFWKSYPSLDGCGHFRKILLFCDFTDKAVPGAQHLHLLLSGRTRAAELVCP